MPRPKTLPDEDLLETALKLMRERGPDALTFAELAKASGLSASTLVQRFNTKRALVRSALLRAWDQLDQRTAALADRVPKTPEGAVELLAQLSGSYGDIETYADNLLILREDLRDPALRARGIAWKLALSRALDGCFAGTARRRRGIGLLMATQWQGALLWWSFDPRANVADYVRADLKNFLSAISA
jgi:AcrR family transcriptional regulator